MEYILDEDNNMDNNNNDVNFDFKHELSDFNMENEFSMESNHSDKKQHEYTLLDFDSIPENSENNNVKAAFDSNIVLQDNEMFTDCSNDTLGNLNHDYFESETPDTQINIENRITFDEENLSKDHTNVIQEVNEKKEQKNQSKTTKASFELKTNNQSGSGSNCDVCSKTVYPMEKTSLDSKIYHKTCFRCCVCQKSLTPITVTKSKNNLFCKPHYVEKFRIRGRYDDIDINSASPDTAGYNKNYTTNQTTNYQPLNTHLTKSGENKEKFVGTKDLSSRFEDLSDKGEETFERKEPIYIGTQRRVSDAAKAWIENPGGNKILKRGNSNNNNINDSEISHVSKGSVKNLKNFFEAKN